MSLNAQCGGAQCGIAEGAQWGGAQWGNAQSGDAHCEGAQWGDAQWDDDQNAAFSACGKGQEMDIIQNDADDGTSPMERAICYEEGTTHQSPMALGDSNAD